MAWARRPQRVTSEQAESMAGRRNRIEYLRIWLPVPETRLSKTLPRVKKTSSARLRWAFAPKKYAARRPDCALPAIGPCAVACIALFPETHQL